MSVEPRPPLITSAPCAAAPCPNASASGTDEVRMSCTVTRAGAPVSRTNAAPTASATLSSSSSGTVPRMSYALKIFAYSAPGVASAPAPAPLAARLGALPGRRRLHYRVGQRLQVVRWLFRGPVGQADHLPADRHRHPVGVRRAQVVAVR